MSALILIIEDEPDLARTVAYNVEKEGFSTEIASTGAAGIQRAIREPHPDLVLLDLMLPDLSGHDVCEQIRSHAATTRLPIIMLTARGEEEDRVKGFEKGADDYVTKPFSTTELMARVRAVLRRIRPGLKDDRITVGDIEIDRVAHKVARNGQDIHLGPTEFRLLDYFMHCLLYTSDAADE